MDQRPSYKHSCLWYCSIFPFLNHQLLLLILNKAGFDSWISFFFSGYLINRKMQYVWNSFVSPFFKTNIDVGWGSVLSPILSVIYIAPIFHIFKKRTKSLLPLIPISTIFFVDDGLFISQEKSYEKSNTNLFCRYNIISFLFIQFCLIIKHNKSEVFYFLRLTKIIYSSSLDLCLLEEPLLYLRDIWRYLGFFFDKKLSFWHYVL